MFLTKLKQKYKKIELLKNFCKNQIGFLQSQNFISYVVVNAILAVINFLFTPDIWWVLFPLFIWGIGVLFDFLKAFVLYGRFDGEEYRERKIEQEMEKLRK